MSKIQTKASAPISLASDERGLSTVEYVILLVLIAAGCIGLWVGVGGKVYSNIEAADAELGKVGVDAPKNAGSDDSK